MKSLNDSHKTNAQAGCVCCDIMRAGWTAFVIISSFFILLMESPPVEAARERDPVTISVVAVNPSDEKPRTFPVKIDMPSEITPDDVIDGGDLTLEYDDQRSIYFLYNQNVTLEPKETRIFTVLVKDVWFIPDEELNKLRNHTNLILKKLKKSNYYDAAQELANSIYSRLDEIRERQEDESLGQKQRIGAFRQHNVMLEEINEDLAEMEKLLTFQGGTPVPQILEESDLKSDAPSTKTTWLIIFSILVFIGLLGAQFFITWNSRAHAEHKMRQKQKQSFPGTPPKSTKSV